MYTHPNMYTSTHDCNVYVLMCSYVCMLVLVSELGRKDPNRSNACSLYMYKYTAGYYSNI